MVGLLAAVNLGAGLYLRTLSLINHFSTQSGYGRAIAPDVRMLPPPQGQLVMVGVLAAVNLVPQHASP